MTTLPCFPLTDIIIRPSANKILSSMIACYYYLNILYNIFLLFFFFNLILLFFKFSVDNFVFICYSITIK